MSVITYTMPRVVYVSVSGFDNNTLSFILLEVGNDDAGKLSVMYQT